MKKEGKKSSQITDSLWQPWGQPKKGAVEEHKNSGKPETEVPAITDNPEERISELSRTGLMSCGRQRCVFKHPREDSVVRSGIRKRLGTESAEVERCS